jgi:hypothetical protein
MLHASKHVQISTEANWLESHVPSVLQALNDDWHPNEKVLRYAYRHRMLILLIRRIQQVEAAAGDFGLRFERLERRDVRIAHRIASPEYWKLQEKLDRFLLRFEASPRMQLVPAMKPGVREGTVFWGLSWIAARQQVRYWYEMRLLNAVVEIAKNGGIKALRQCEHCQKWLFARRPAIDRFCTSECRELFHRTNEADRKRRRDWARENYQSRKELELGSRKKAHRKGGKR